MKAKEIKVGEYVMCYYYISLSDYSEGVDLYYCKILAMDDEYAICEIYNGEEFNPKKIRGIFKDVCVADLRPFEE